MKEILNQSLKVGIFCPVILLFSGSLFSPGYAQSKPRENIFIIKGTVTDDTDNAPLPGTTVYAKESKKATTTDHTGQYMLQLPQGRHTITISYLGYVTIEKVIDVSENYSNLDFRLKERQNELDEVVVTAKSKSAQAREQGVPVAVIDGKTLAGRGTSIAEVLNHQTGVKIRQTGGVGSETKINVRGLEGNRVQIYMDGNPLNTPDGSFSINDIPLQFIERVEIYKGIVPPEFGGDGLGSAVNVVTIDPEDGFYDAWYSYKSYGIHEGSLLFKHYFEKQKMYASAFVGLGYAKNNYTMKSPYAEGLTIERDHDMFRKCDGAVTFDFKDRYFDELEFENLFYLSDKQIQGIQTNIRHAGTSGWLIGIAPKLTKYGFLTEKLDLKFNGLVVHSVSHQNDTSSYIYDFDGNRYPNTYRGEIGTVPNLSDDRSMDYRANLNFKYHLFDNMSVNLNNDFRHVDTETNDTIADRYLNARYSGLKTHITTLISSLCLENGWFDKRLTTILTGRNYLYNVTGKTVDLSWGTQAAPVPADEQHNYLGYSLALKYQITSKWLAKLALEHNYRLPRSEELLGDRVRFVPNTSLKPEQADNYNLGFMYDNNYGSMRRLQFETNVYAIKVEDMMQTRSTAGYLSYYNIGQALLTGADVEVKWDMNTNWFVMFNATYQRSIDKSKYVAGTNTLNITYDMQLPHVPVFFVNWMLDYRKENLFGGKGQYTRLYYEGGYTDQYYYGYELTANQNYTIPAAGIHTAGIEYAIRDRTLLFSLECHNLFDTKELTNLNYPLPGRTITAKIRITSLKW